MQCVRFIEYKLTPYIYSRLHPLLLHFDNEIPIRVKQLTTVSPVIGFVVDARIEERAVRCDEILLKVIAQATL